MNYNFKKIVTEKIELPILKEKNIDLQIIREDKIHPLVSGNKYRKLKYNIIRAKKEGYQKILTFGGAYSNHIAAVAFAGKEAGIKTIGIIRGEELGDKLNRILNENKTLQTANKNNMNLEFISREDYRLKNTVTFTKHLKSLFGDFYLIPEGGTNIEAIKGCEEILTEKHKDFDFITTAVGTGGTISGLINSSKSNQTVLGYPALKEKYLEKEITKWVNKTNWKLIRDFHFGGYAKSDDELIHFINWFYLRTKIKLDPVYTGKMLFGVIEMIKKDYFTKNTRILAVHTGGLQGVSGYNNKLRHKGRVSINWL